MGQISPEHWYSYIKIHNCHISEHHKSSRYNILALPVLLCGSEMWTIKERDARRITAAEMKYMRRTADYRLDRLKNKYTNYKRIKNNNNSVQITGIQGKLDITSK